jgi:hypothetical protein
MFHIALLDMTTKLGTTFIHYKEHHTLRLIIHYAYSDDQIKGDETDAKWNKYVLT